MRNDIDRILITREQIADRIAELGTTLTKEFDALGPEEEIVILPILTGSIIFVADLIRELAHKVRLDVVTVSSYPGKAMTSQGASIIGEMPQRIEGRHILVVDDILDSGTTISLIRRELLAAGAKSVRACVLLRKKREAAMATECEHVGFDIPDEFVVGYGLDYDHYYRNFPEIGILKPEAI